MTPELIAMLIASITDIIIRVAAEHENISYEEMKAKVEALQTKADDLEMELRGAEKKV